MWITIKFNVNSLTNKISSSVKTWINQALRVIKAYAEKISPEDTKEFISNHQIKNAVDYWNKILWSLENNTPYAIYLECWVAGKRYNYHKWARKWPRNVIYTWVWNRTYTRTIADNNKSIVDIIRESIKNA